MSHSSLSLTSAARQPSQVQTNLMQTAHSLLFSCFTVLGYPPHRNPVHALLYPSTQEASPLIKRRDSSSDLPIVLDDEYTAHVPSPEGSPCTLGLWLALQHAGCDVCLNETAIPDSCRLYKTNSREQIN